MITPSSTSARMFSRVCETIVPITVGRFSRGRPVRRATMSARDGSPRRAGSVADMSTPMKVPCSASVTRSRALGSAARRISCQASARTAIDRHMRPSETTTQTGLDASRLAAMRSRPMRCSAMTDSPAPASPATTMAPRRAAVRSARALRPQGRLEARDPPRRRGGTAVGGREAGPAGQPGARAGGGRRRGDVDRLLVGVDDLAGDLGPGEAARAPRPPRPRTGPGGHGPGPGSRSVSASAVASPRGTSTPSRPSRSTSR